MLSLLQNPYFLEWWVPTPDRNELAFYGTAPLLETLRKHVNLPITPSGKTRLSLGATRVSDGETVFFDSASTSLEPKHVMASSALPPAFPAIEVDGEWHFDGGLSSNTPIEALHEDLLKYGDKILVFVVDLWDRKAPTHKNPKTWDELLWRQRCIQYGSRKTGVERLVRHHEERVKIGSIKPVQLEICQVMLEASPNAPQFCLSDADFLYSTFNELSKRGENDMNEALEVTEVLRPMRKSTSIRAWKMCPNW